MDRAPLLPIPVTDGFELATDVSVAEWITSRLWSWDPPRVGTLVPPTFESYARILHPAEDERDQSTRKWARLAKPGFEIGPETDFDDVSQLEPGSLDWDRIQPSDGEMPAALLATLSEVLSEFTVSTYSWVAYWEGHGSWTQDDSSTWHEENARGKIISRIPKVDTGDLKCLLFRTELSTVASFKIGTWPQSPSLWWPENRTWCVATAYHGYSSYIGGSRECIEALTHSADIEALTVPIDARLDWGSSPGQRPPNL